MLEKSKSFAHSLYVNALQFIFTVGFVMIYQALFGGENTLVGVAIGVGWTMYPKMDLNIRPTTFAGISIFLYLLTALAGNSAYVNPWLAILINFAVVVIILVCSLEPVDIKPSITFLLCFVFAQATPVPIEALPTRMLGALVSSIFVAATTYLYWKHYGYGKEGLTLRQVIKESSVHKSYILRMAIGLAAAMFIGMWFHLPKPLWISIVVMSLTQVEFHETLERIKHRSFATIVGVIAFIVVFDYIIPQEYAFIVVLLLGYFSYFAPAYKYKQVVNAICAINASLLFLDSLQAIQNRFFCLLGGILIVLCMWFIQHPMKKIHYHILHKSKVSS